MTEIEVIMITLKEKLQLMQSQLANVTDRLDHLNPGPPGALSAARLAHHTSMSVVHAKALIANTVDMISIATELQFHLLAEQHK